MGRRKKLNIDVDKILGLNKDDLAVVETAEYDSDIYGDYEPDAEVLTPQQMREAIASANSEFELNQKSEEEIKEDAANKLFG